MSTTKSAVPENMMADELKLLLNSDQGTDHEKAVQYLVGLLTSPDKGMRRRGCELFEEGLNEGLYQSCLNYRSLVGGVTHPLISVLTRSVEAWSARVEDRKQKRQESKTESRTRVGL